MTMNSMTNDEHAYFKRQADKDPLIDEIRPWAGTKAKAYVPWLRKRLFNEPLEDVLPLVRAFHQLVQKQKLRGADADLYRYKNPGELQTKIESIEPLPREIEELQPDSVVDGYKLYRPQDQDEAIAAGQGTTWCTARTRGDNLFYSYAMSGVTLVQGESPDGQKFSVGFENGRMSPGKDGHLTVAANNKAFDPAAELPESVLAEVKRLGELPPVHDKIYTLMQTPGGRSALTRGKRFRAVYPILLGIHLAFRNPMQKLPEAAREVSRSDLADFGLLVGDQLRTELSKADAEEQSELTELRSTFPDEVFGLSESEVAEFWEAGLRKSFEPLALDERLQMLMSLFTPNADGASAKELELFTETLQAYAAQPQDILSWSEDLLRRVTFYAEGGAPGTRDDTHAQLQDLIFAAINSLSAEDQQAEFENFNPVVLSVLKINDPRAQSLRRSWFPALTGGTATDDLRAAQAGQGMPLSEILSTVQDDEARDVLLQNLRRQLHIALSGQLSAARKGVQPNDRVQWLDVHKIAPDVEALIREHVTDRTRLDELRARTSPKDDANTQNEFSAARHAGEAFQVEAFLVKANKKLRKLQNLLGESQPINADFVERLKELDPEGKLGLLNWFVEWLRFRVLSRGDGTSRHGDVDNFAEGDPVTAVTWLEDQNKFAPVQGVIREVVKPRDSHNYYKVEPLDGTEMFDVRAGDGNGKIRAIEPRPGDLGKFAGSDDQFSVVMYLETWAELPAYARTPLPAPDVTSAQLDLYEHTLRLNREWHSLPRKERAERISHGAGVYEPRNKDGAAFYYGGSTDWCFAKWDWNYWENSYGTDHGYLYIIDLAEAGLDVDLAETFVDDDSPPEPYPTRVAIFSEDNKLVNEARNQDDKSLSSDALQPLLDHLNKVIGAELKDGRDEDDDYDDEVGWDAVDGTEEAWRAAGVQDHHVASAWQAYGFSPEEAQPWIAAGYDHVQTARLVQGGGLDPQHAAAYADMIQTAFPVDTDEELARESKQAIMNLVGHERIVGADRLDPNIDFLNALAADFDEHDGEIDREFVIGMSEASKRGLDYNTAEAYWNRIAMGSSPIAAQKALKVLPDDFTKASEVMEGWVQSEGDLLGGNGGWMHGLTPEEGDQALAVIRRHPGTGHLTHIGDYGRWLRAGVPLEHFESWLDYRNLPTRDENELWLKDFFAAGIYDAAEIRDFRESGKNAHEALRELYYSSKRTVQDVLAFVKTHGNKFQLYDVIGSLYGEELSDVLGDLSDERLQALVDEMNGHTASFMAQTILQDRETARREQEVKQTEGRQREPDLTDRPPKDFLAPEEPTDTTPEEPEAPLDDDDSMHEPRQAQALRKVYHGSQDDSLAGEHLSTEYNSSYEGSVGWNGVYVAPTYETAAFYGDHVYQMEFTAPESSVFFLTPHNDGPGMPNLRFVEALAGSSVLSGEFVEAFSFNVGSQIYTVGPSDTEELIRAHALEEAGLSAEAADAIEDFTSMPVGHSHEFDELYSHFPHFFDEETGDPLPNAGEMITAVEKRVEEVEKSLPDLGLIIDLEDIGTEVEQAGYRALYVEGIRPMEELLVFHPDEDLTPLVGPVETPRQAQVLRKVYHGSQDDNVGSRQVNVDVEPIDYRRNISHTATRLPQTTAELRDVLASMPREQIDQLQQALDAYYQQREADGGLILYHGTTSNKADQIKSEGFALAQGQRPGFFGLNRVVQNQAVFLSENVNTAAAFGANRDPHGGSDSQVMKVRADVDNVLDMTEALPSALLSIALQLVRTYEGRRVRKLRQEDMHWLLDQPEFVQAVKSAGFDAVRFNESDWTRRTLGVGEGATIAVFDPANLTVIPPRRALTDLLHLLHTDSELASILSLNDHRERTGAVDNLHFAGKLFLEGVSRTAASGDDLEAALDEASRVEVALASRAQAAGAFVDDNGTVSIDHSNEFRALPTQADPEALRTRLTRMWRRESQDPLHASFVHEYIDHLHESYEPVVAQMEARSDELLARREEEARAEQLEKLGQEYESWDDLPDAGPVWALHGTSTTQLADILRNGLKPQSDTGLKSFDAETTDGVFLDLSGETVNFYANRAAKTHGGEPVVLRVLVDAADLEPDPDDADIPSGRHQVLLRGQVPPSNIYQVNGRDVQKTASVLDVFRVKAQTTEALAEPPVACVDLDGTLLAPVDHSAPEEMSGQPELGEPNRGAKGAMSTLSDLGWRIVIHTARFENARDATLVRQEIEEHLRHHGIKFDDVATGPKPVADVYIDDKAVAFDGDWWMLVKDITKQAEVTNARTQWFHGGTAERKHFSDQHMDRDRSAQDLNAMGPGIYFTSDYDQAAGYAGSDGSVYTVSFTGRMLDEDKLPNAEVIHAFVDNLSPEAKELMASNWDPDIEKGLSKAISSAVEYNKTLLDALLDLKSQAIPDDPNTFTAIMTSLGYDALLHKLPAVEHLVVYNPNSVKIVKEEKASDVDKQADVLQSEQPVDENEWTDATETRADPAIRLST